MTDKAQTYVDSLNVPYNAIFIPQSQSRNANERHRSLNWRIMFGDIHTDYMQGIGHVPNYSEWGRGRRTLHVAEREGQAAEKGRYWPSKNSNLFGTGKKIPAPKLIDVLHSLVIDADAIEHGCFEDWADTFGYDPDSRKAYETYQACIGIALKLRQHINLNEAREAFEDY